MFKKILIANRGEIALRIIRSCREMGIKTVLVYSTADESSLATRFADETVCIGPPSSQDSYLDMQRILATAEITNPDAIHPGYGFLAENAEFAELCEQYGIKFIGPTAHMIQRMGDKITAKSTMKKAGVPVIPGSDGLITTMPKAAKEAKKIGYPVILKATAGGGGKGMRIVWSEEELEPAFVSAQTEARAAFGNDGMYLEKFIEEPHHIEFQIAGDQHGNVCHLSERDCSIQRRHQKLIEESPSPIIDEATRRKMGKAAIKAARAINYESVGTVEFLVDKNRDFYFMEMNTRIQVEHPVTEEVMDFDLIKEQIQIAAGATIDVTEYLPKDAHAIECRINAEDPSNNFAPCPGTINYFHAPKGHGVRVDTALYAGYRIPPYYDSLIAKLIVRAHDRPAAIAKMRRALDEFIIEGIKTTIPFHRKMMDNPAFQAGTFDTSFMESFDLSTL